MAENIGAIEYQVRADISELMQSVRRVDTATSKMSTSFTRLASSIAGVVSATALVNKLIAVSRQFSVMGASLQTMTGSLENSKAAFSELESFAAKTPFTLEQSVSAFTKLVSLGLNPSQKAMESYGNTASAMGKDLTQMIEAVADAATGEFERLKEFGIKASAQGDKVSFTFQGVTTTVANNANAIEGYLQSIGETNFAGAMADRMATLDGALSNLEDSWNSLFRAVSSAGTGDVIKDAAKAATDALQELTAMISSGELQHLIGSWGEQWKSTFDDLSFFIGAIDDYFTATMNGWGATGESASGILSSAFWDFPANIRAAIQIATVEFAGFVDKVGVYSEMLGAYLNPANWMDSTDIASTFNAQLDAINKNVTDTTSIFLAERDKSIGKLNQETEAAKQLRAEYDKGKKSIDLGQFRKGSTNETQKKSASEIKKEISERQKNITKIEELSQKLAVAKLETSGMRREAAMLTAEQSLNSKATDEQIKKVRNLAGAIFDLNKKEKEQEELKRKKKEAKAFATDVEMDAMNPLQRIDAEEQAKLAKLEEYRTADALSLQAYEDAKTAITKKASDDRVAYERQVASMLLSSSADMFGGMADLAKTFGGEQSTAYKAMFAVSKGFAIANAALQLQTAIANAMALPFPANLPAIGQAVALGGQVASSIAGVSYGGGRRYGGPVNPGSMYQVNESGNPEMMIAGGKQYLLPNSRGEVIPSDSSTGGAGVQWQIVVNNTAPGVDVQSSVNDETKTVTLAVQEVARQLGSRTGPVAQGLQRGFNVPGRTS